MPHRKKGSDVALNRQMPTATSEMAHSDPRDELDWNESALTTRSILPQVTQRNPLRDSLGMVGGLAVVGLIGGLTLWAMQSSRETREQVQSAPVSASPVNATGQSVPLTGQPIATSPNNQMPGAVLPYGQQPAVLAAPPQGAVATAPVNNQAYAPIVIYDTPAPTAPSTAGSAASVGASQPSVPSNAGTGTPPDEFASRVGGVGGSAAVASANFDPRNTVTQGTLIPAVLETAINTDVPGYVRAVVSVDVRSFDGRRVLVPRSSRLIGQYKSGLQAGQKRAYVIWARLIRPDGVSVNINSPAIGFGGETGLAGRVNTHFFERFGSAILLSVVGGLAAGSGNAGVVIASGGQSAAAAAIGQSGQIGPTIRVRQGQPIRVFTARDLDFSKVEK